VTIKKDYFLSQTIGKDFFHIENFTLEEFLKIDKFIIKKNSILSLSIKKNIKINPENHNLLICNGFKLVGILTTYELDLNSTDFIDNDNPKIRKAKKSDEIILKRIAKNNFFDDKLHQDVQIEKSKADNYFENWIVNSINGLTDYVYVYEENNTIMGFITFNMPKNKENYSQIILNAIDLPFTRTGKYKELLKFVINFNKDLNVPKLRIGTYEKSIGVHKSVSNEGFIPIFYTFIYHFHVKI
jgi:hypothetical protein